MPAMDANNKMERLVASMDFAAHQGSWYDMWNMHPDWDGKGTDDADVRRKHLLEAINIYDTFWTKMDARGKPYQAWILVDIADASEDAVYVHSPDPHSDSPFPIRIKLERWEQPPTDDICQLFVQRGFALYVQPQHEDMYFFARPGVGVPLV
jgi:hypothetical protein